MEDIVDLGAPTFNLFRHAFCTKVKKILPIQFQVSLSKYMPARYFEWMILCRVDQNMQSKPKLSQPKQSMKIVTRRVSTTEYPLQLFQPHRDITQSSSLPVSDSVHVLGGLDINEMDCFRRRVSTLLS